MISAGVLSKIEVDVLGLSLPQDFLPYPRGVSCEKTSGLFTPTYGNTSRILAPDDLLNKIPVTHTAS
jgi:hypothetical protein